MSSIVIQPPVDELAYEQIEAAVMETSRGRWFLQEYAARHRHADTRQVLGAIETLTRTLAPRPADGAQHRLPQDRFTNDIIEMARAIARTERDMRALRGDQGSEKPFVSASDELDAVVETTEQATSSILSAAEQVQEQAWTMRERDGNLAECDLLDACATEIYTACGFQDLTAQRIRKVIGTLRFLDQRIKAMLESAGLADDLKTELDAAHPPAEQTSLRTSDIWMSEAHQAEIDDTFDFFVPAETSEPTMIGADLLDLEAEVLLPASKKTGSTAPRGKSKGKPAEPLAAATLPASSSQSMPPQERVEVQSVIEEQSSTTKQASIAEYDTLPVEARLRAFR